MLIFYATIEEDLEGRLETETFENVNGAISRYEYLERLLFGRADVVLVRADTEASVRSTFRNYFFDTEDFLNYMEQGTSLLREIGPRIDGELAASAAD